MSKTLRYLPEGKDFGGRDFDNRHVFSPSGHKPQAFANGGPVTNRQLNPSTDPTSDKAKADNKAEHNWRQSGGYGFKKGGKVNKGDRNANLMRAAQAQKMCRGGMAKKGYAEGGTVKKPAPSLAERLFGAVVKAHPMGNAMDKVNKALSKAGDAGAAAGGAGKATAKQKYAKGGKVKKYAIGGITPMQPGALTMAKPTPMAPPTPMAQPVPLNPQTFGGTATMDAGKLPGAQPGPGMPTQTLPPPVMQTAVNDLASRVSRRAGVPRRAMATGGKVAPAGGMIGTIMQAMQQKATAAKAAQQAPFQTTQPSGPMAPPQPTPGFQGNGRSQGDTGVALPPALAQAGSSLGEMAGKIIAKRIAGKTQGKMRMAKGGSVNGDVSQDRAMVKKGVRQHETGMHKGQRPTKLKLNMGGMVDPSLGMGMGMGGPPMANTMLPQNNGMQPITTLRSGGKVH